jgi:hypothetical protein
MAKKIWVAGDQVLAADLNGNFKFGGTGADGALSVSSGNTNIDAAGAAILVKNYTSISITGTGSVTLINPHDQRHYPRLKKSGQCDLDLIGHTDAQRSGYGCGRRSYCIGNTLKYFKR